ncbi:MAG TPA: carboxypeptidase regulatory-like domain-containing protein [Acidobacteriaceae bacterium]
MAAHAQVNTASLSGFVTDASGGVDAGAKVTATNEATGYSRELATDATGFYSFQTMPIGKYTVKVEQSGFAAVQEDVVLSVGEKGRQDFHLQVGSAQQTVEVQANASLLSPDDASVSTIVGAQTIQQTPLYLRNWDDLLRTVPGVQISRYTQQSGNTSAGRTGDFNVNGVHSLQNNFILDGIDNNTFSENVQELSTEASHPSVDVIQEFNVITNPYSAEYGRSPGAVVSVNTKSGANQMHGLLFEYLRNNYFDANDFFTKRAGKPRTKNNQNQFGGSIGGPVKKDKLFYFFNYEGTRIKTGVTRTSTVPLNNERIGDFSPQAAAAAGLKPYPTIKDPVTGQPFLNNQIPANRIDTAVAKLIGLFPEPNYAPGGGSFSETNNYFRTGLLTDNDDNYNARMDWIAGPNDTLFGRYNYSNRSRSIPGYFGGLADGSSTSAWGNQVLKSHSFVLGWTHLFSPTVVNDFRLGFLRNFSHAAQQPFALPQTAGQFVPGIPPSPLIGGGVPLTTFSGSIGAFLGSPDFLPKQQVPQLLQYNDTVSITRGKQTLKAGASIYAPMRNIFQDEGGMRGDLTFTGVFTGFPYADGLLGYTQSTQLTNVMTVDQRLWMASGFFEDDWKATPQLTLNLGLRYDFSTPAMTANDQMANFSPTGNGGAGALVFAKSGSVGDRSLIDPSTKNFGPRFGVSFSPDTKTVLRGGYGIYYTLFERIGSEDQLALNPPFLVNRTAASSTQSVLTPEVGFPSGYLDPANINLNQLQSYHVRAVNPHSPSPQVQQWSLGFQREFAGAWTAEANYVGTKSTHLTHLVDYNQPFIVNGKATSTIPYPNFGYIEYADSTSFGNYNGLQASLNHTFRSGLNMRAAYTHSRSLDNAPEELESNSGSAPDGRNYASWYGPSDFDIPHRVSVNYVYELPFGHGKSMLTQGPLAWVLGNWRTAGVYTYYSGHPFQVNAGSLNNALDPYGVATATPMLIGKPKVVGDPDCWYYTSKNKACATIAPGQADAYAAAPAGVIGNVGRNTLRGPRISVFDASLLKEFPIRERGNVEFRWEVFNVANTPEFGQPGGNITSGSAGQITSLSGDQRVMQFALRLSF